MEQAAKKPIRLFGADRRGWNADGQIGKLQHARQSRKTGAEHIDDELGAGDVDAAQTRSLFIRADGEDVASKLCVPQQPPTSSARPSVNQTPGGANIREWWERERGQVMCFVSDLVVREVSAGDPQQARLRMNILQDIPRLTATSEGDRFAAALLAGHVLPPRAIEDAAHLALATVAEMDYVLTWNCRHLANARMVRQALQIAATMGLRLPTICTPEELMEGNKNE